MRGGSSGRDDLCGIFYIRFRNIYSATSWDFCAALSFKLIASYYTRRGGFSYPEGYSGEFCGNFTVTIDRAYSITGWHTGAALL